MSAARAYGRLDRLLHRLAFAGIPAQIALADVEQRLYRRDIQQVDGVARPVFVAALPRAGTTLLLELLNRLPDFATHTYRQMPFVLCPLLWDRVTRGLRTDAPSRERAHGDGVRIGYDSPEAFEDIVWKAYWPEKYRADRIRLWSPADRNAVFETFFKNHMRSIVALQSAQPAQRRIRYLSKNNANIGRIPLLATLFPDCRIVVPVRDPWSHAASLLRQHRRFSALHARDAFARQYMEWLGHYEFGANLRPIDFGAWLSRRAVPDTASPRFWLDYWQAAYGAVLAAASPHVVFVDYDELCRAPRPALRRLAAALDIDAPERLLAQAGRLRPPTVHDRVPAGVDRQTAERIQTLHQRLRVACGGTLRSAACA